MTDVRRRLAAARRATWARWRTTIVLALRMMVHDKAKFVGTTLGVVFAVVLGSQQLGVLFGLLSKNTQYVDNAGADLWIVPPGTDQVQPGQRLSTQLLYRARATPGVASAAPVVMVGTSIAKPGGGTEAVTLIGYDLDRGLGGPWNVVAGSPDDLRHHGALFFEDAERERFGGLNLGSVREVQGRKVWVAGFTWGLLPFGPAYTFGDEDLVREITGVPTDQLNFVLVTVAPEAAVGAVRAELQARIPTAEVVTTAELHDRIVGALLSQQLGITFGTTTAFALVIGFIIVSLSMFSAVIDNLREFGTLKAIGMTNWDLTRMLVVQSIAYALIGTLVGLGLVAVMADGIRSATLSVIVPTTLVIAAPLVMTALCVVASALALRRVRRLEPGMVFR